MSQNSNLTSDILLTKACFEQIFPSKMFLLGLLLCGSMPIAFACGPILIWPMQQEDLDGLMNQNGKIELDQQ